LPGARHRGLDQVVWLARAAGVAAEQAGAPGKRITQLVGRQAGVEAGNELGGERRHGDVPDLGMVQSLARLAVPEQALGQLFAGP